MNILPSDAIKELTKYIKFESDIKCFVNNNTEDLSYRKPIDEICNNLEFINYFFDYYQQNYSTIKNGNININKKISLNIEFLITNNGFTIEKIFKFPINNFFNDRFGNDDHIYYDYTKIFQSLGKNIYYVESGQINKIEKYKYNISYQSSDCAGVYFEISNNSIKLCSEYIIDITKTDLNYYSDNDVYSFENSSISFVFDKDFLHKILICIRQYYTFKEYICHYYDELNDNNYYADKFERINNSIKLMYYEE